MQIRARAMAVISIILFNCRAVLGHMVVGGGPHGTFANIHTHTRVQILQMHIHTYSSPDPQCQTHRKPLRASMHLTASARGRTDTNKLRYRRGGRILNSTQRHEKKTKHELTHPPEPHPRTEYDRPRCVPAPINTVFYGPCVRPCVCVCQVSWMYADCAGMRTQIMGNGTDGLTD